jgi:hypothetical protein
MRERERDENERGREFSTFSPRERERVEKSSSHIDREASSIKFFFSCVEALVVSCWLLKFGAHALKQKRKKRVEKIFP